MKIKARPLGENVIRNVYKFPLKPNKAQISEFSQTFGVVRLVWNYFLAERKQAWEQSRKMVSGYDQSKRISLFKKEDGGDIIAQPPSQAISNLPLRLDEAYASSFRRIRAGEKAGFPKFKSRDYGGSFSTTQGFKMDFERNKIFVPKIGWVKTRFDRCFDGVVKTCTVRETPSGKFRISILVEEKGSYPTSAPIEEKTAIGINLGIANYATLDTGEKFANPKFFELYEKKICYAQYVLSRRKRGSVRWHNQRRRVAILYEQLTNQRDYFQHNLSNDLLKRFDTIFLGVWDIKGMMEKKEDEKKKVHKKIVGKRNMKRIISRNLNKRLSDVAPFEMGRKFGYKAIRQGKNVVRGAKSAKETKVCSHCFHVNDWVTIKNRTWQCENTECNRVHDIDRNAAINQKQWGLTELRLKKEGVLKA